MCLTVNVYLGNEYKIGRQQVRDLQAGVLGYYVHLNKPLFSRRGRHLTIYELGEGGCACSLLSEEAGFDSSTWDLRIEMLEGLAQLINRIWDISGGLLIFDALWYAKGPEEDRNVTIEELNAIIRTNKLGSKTRYFVISEEDLKILKNIKEKNKNYLGAMEELLRKVEE